MTKKVFVSLPKDIVKTADKLRGNVSRDAYVKAAVKHYNRRLAMTRRITPVKPEVIEPTKGHGTMEPETRIGAPVVAQ